MDISEAIEWATAEAERLRQLAAAGRMTYASTTPGLEFLKLQDPNSTFYKRGLDIVAKQYSDTAAEAVADLLVGWVATQKAGIVSAIPFEARIRVEASTDLMEQVHRLLGDKGIHVAAPIVLAGAGLEEFLRSMVLSEGVAFSRKPGIQAYAEELAKADLLTTQDVKDIIAWAGMRNDAAHGRFDNLSLEGAQIMVAGINLFMRQHAPD